MKYMIVGYDENRAIGAKGGIPWAGKLPTDVRHVRDTTMGAALIMGRKTFDSIGRALPGRQNIVVTHHPATVENVTFVPTLEAAYDAVEPGRDVVIFGGSQIYAMALGSVDKILATEIATKAENADAFFPPLSADWHETSREHHEADGRNAFAYDFVVYEKQRS